MRRTYLYFARLWTYTWLRIPLVILGILSLCAVIWFGFQASGVGLLQSAWLRGGLIAAILATIGAVSFLRYRKRRKAAAELEESLIETPVGDGAVLAERMQDALSRLKKTGGATYLYDLPWYVIIGPPGAGKTTALVHSGLEFPGTDASAVAGFGGTKNCDFWFAEEAVMIDTAGRYTTQDSDARADKMSWAAFLEQLKRSRPDQPVNGVILAFSCEEMMSATDEALDSHALAVRARLAELNEALKINVPVYVIFTKADMIAGFREYFGPYGEERRKSVWGVTFQTKDRKEETYRSVAAEFDQLISRLSDEVTDRLNEEPDSVARIALFGFPGQMALLQRNVTDFLRRVFQKPQEINAILRGFYFTSGTQEGTPIDQVLGALSAQGSGPQPGFMSGKGRSYFLHDLLKKVIFEERDWVGYDFKAMRRRAIFRGGAKGLIGAACIAALGAFGYSFWINMGLVREAEQKQRDYVAVAQGLLDENIVDNSASRPLLDALREVRGLPAGYAFPSLERLLRPRMMLHLENRLPRLLNEGNIEEAYTALKVYILLAKEQDGRDDDIAIQHYFAEAWIPEYSEPGLDEEYQQINEHLAAMLDLDDQFRVDPVLKPNKELVEKVQKEIALLPLAKQAYSSILSDAAALPPFKLIDALADVQAEAVFRTTDGRSLETLQVPGLFTQFGYWDTFQTLLAESADRLEQERWVLGAPGDGARYEDQLVALTRDLHVLYAADFRKYWMTMLESIELVPMSNGAPQYPALAAASSGNASPILRLAEAVDDETRLSRLLDEVDNIALTPEQLPEGNIGGQLADVGVSEIERRAGALQRIAIGMARDRVKFQERAVASVNAPSQRRQLEEIEQPFERWHNLLRDRNGAPRLIDVFLGGLDALHENRAVAASSTVAGVDEAGMNRAFVTISSGSQFYPETILRFVNKIEREFKSVTASASIEELNRALVEEVSAYCTQNIAPTYPFKSNGSRFVSTSVFGEFFGYRGKMQSFYENRLRDHTQRAPDGSLEAREGSVIGERLSQNMLSQFVRAERIRQAFFEPDSVTPSVTFSISQVQSSSGIEGTQIRFGDRDVQLLPNSSGVRVRWPDDVNDISLTLLPQSNRVENTINFPGGRWALSGFIIRGQSERRGTSVDVVHQVGGRSVKLRLDFDSTAVPFLMRELTQFSCPTTVE